MTKFKLLSAAFVAAAMLATPAMAHTSHETSWHLAADANPSAFPTTHYNTNGPVGIRAPHVGTLAMAPSEGGSCDVGDDPHIC
jgi:hypothetical protein